MMKLKLDLGRLAVVVGLLGVATVCLAAAGDADLSDKDRSFLKEAAQGGLAEVQMGRYIVDHTMNNDVKQFAQQMVDDHTKINNQLTSLAQQKNYVVPADIGSKNQEEMNKLMQLTGFALDRKYMTDMVRDHEKDVSAFQHEAEHGKDPDIRQFAQSTLPTLKSHLNEAKNIEMKLKKSQTANR